MQKNIAERPRKDFDMSDLYATVLFSRPDFLSPLAAKRCLSRSLLARFHKKLGYMQMELCLSSRAAPGANFEEAHMYKSYCRALDTDSTIHVKFSDLG